MGYLWLSRAVYDRDWLTSRWGASKSHGDSTIDGVSRNGILIDWSHENYDLLLTAFGDAHIEAGSAAISGKTVYSVCKVTRWAETAEHSTVKKFQQSNVSIVTELAKNRSHTTLGRCSIR